MVDHRLKKIFQDSDGGGESLAALLRADHPAFADVVTAACTTFADKDTSVSEAFYVVFDQNRHPAFVGSSRTPSAAATFAALSQTLNTLMDAARKEWPAQKICAPVTSPKDSVAYRIDFGELVAALAAESKDARDTNAVAAVRAKVAAFLGSAFVCRLATTQDGLAFTAAADGAVLPAPAPAAAARARLDAILPELAAGPQPLGAGWFSLVALARPLVQDYIATLPADKAAFNTPLLATIPADPGKGVGLAGWSRKDGSLDLVLRVSADEIRGLGAVFGVVTGMAMGGDAASDSTGDDSDDDL